jgi:hypothetical protein
MRDIRGDLRERASAIRQQINAECAQFELLIAQQRSEFQDRLKGLEVQTRAVTQLLVYANWHHEVRMAVARALALAAAAEIASREFAREQIAQRMANPRGDTHDLRK